MSDKGACRQTGVEYRQGSVATDDGRVNAETRHSGAHEREGGGGCMDGRE